jgi:hypothetical protein
MWEKMNTKLLALIVGGMTVAFAGCVSTVDGKKQAGVPFVSDTVEGRYERTFDQVWTATRDALKQNGVLTVENVVGHTFEAKVDQRTVWVLVESLNKNLTRLVIQVRTKGGGADRDLGSFLREQVAVRLASGNLAPSSTSSAK